MGDRKMGCSGLSHNAVMRGASVSQNAGLSVRGPRKTAHKSSSASDCIANTSTCTNLACASLDPPETLKTTLYPVKNQTISITALWSPCLRHPQLTQSPTNTPARANPSMVNQHLESSSGHPSSFGFVVSSTSRTCFPLLLLLPLGILVKQTPSNPTPRNSSFSFDFEDRACSPGRA